MNVHRAHFLVQDLLSAEQKSEYFLKHEIIFTNVILCGVITRVEQIFDEQDFFIFTVDDGTACITCVLYVDPNDTQCVNSEKIREDDICHPEDSVINMIKLSTLRLERLKNLSKDFKVSDDVELIGVLKQEEDLRYIFIEGIQKLDVSQTIANKKIVFASTKY